MAAREYVSDDLSDNLTQTSRVKVPIFINFMHPFSFGGGGTRSVRACVRAGVRACVCVILVSFFDGILLSKQYSHR